MSGSNEQSVRAFIAEYCAAWGSTDMNRIAPLYSVPMLTLRGDSSIHCLHSEAEIRAFFQAAVDQFVAMNFETVDISGLNWMPMGNAAAVVSLTWTLRRSPDVVVYQYDQTYNVRRAGERWEVYASTVHV